MTDAAASDAAGGKDGSSGGGSDSGTQTKDCFASWMSGNVKIQTPTPITGLATVGTDERDPWVAPGGLELYYSHAGSSGDSDIYRSVRATTNDAFPTGSVVTGISQGSDESRATMNQDGTIIVFTSDRGGGNKWLIYSGVRADTTQSFSAVTTDRTDALNIGNSQYDPFITRDGLAIYYAPFPPPGNQLQHIYVSIRASLTDDFSAPSVVPVINQAGSYDADPALSPDGRLIVFSSTRPGVGDSNLWYATRATAMGNFGPPVQIPSVNSASSDGDPVLSDDGCTLYFASKRAGNNDYDIYQAIVGD